MILPRALLVLSCCLLALGATATLAQPPAPLRLGVGGDYPNGLDGLLVSRGLPHERIFPWEMADPAVLKRFDVVLLSCPNSTRGAIEAPLTEYVRGGGRLFIETWAGMQGPDPLSRLFADAGRTATEADAILTGIDHPITRDLPRTPINLFHLQGVFVRRNQPAEGTVLAQFAPDGSTQPYSGGEAVIHQRIGAGELVYSGAPLSFCCLHRGPTTEPLMMRIIEYLAQGRAVARLRVPTPDPLAVSEAPAPSTRFIDPVEGKIPAGFSVLETAADGPYNVQAQASAQSLKAQGETLILLDGRFQKGDHELRSALWVAMTHARLQVRSGRLGAARVLASVPWKLGGQPAELLIRRRSGLLSIGLGEREVLRTKTTVSPAGLVAAQAGSVRLADARYQPVEPPAFDDDFMRESGEPGLWTPASGSWQVVGLGNEAQSVNGFYLRGASDTEAVTTAGESWWDDYAVSTAVRLDSARTVGLCVLRQADGDCLALLADAASSPNASLRLVARRGKQETVLAQRAGGLEPRQWYRLSVRIPAEAGLISAALDGQPCISAAQSDPRGGGIALLTRGGTARFDDVLLQPTTQPTATPRNEGSPTALLPPSVGPQDSLTWANPASSWRASPERPSLLWHEGDFTTGVTLAVAIAPSSEAQLRRLILAPDCTTEPDRWASVTLTTTPGSPTAALKAVLPGVAPLQRPVSLTAPRKLFLVRRGPALTVEIDNQVLLRADVQSDLPRTAVEVEGPPVSLGDLQVVGAQVRDYVFGVAPTDWYVSSGTWEVASRWACDKRWSWFAGWGVGDFAVWNKHRVEGNVAMAYHAGIKMEAPGGGETVRCRDLNATLCGDRMNPRSGYTFIIGGDGGAKTQLLRNGVVVAENPELRVPAGYGIHHEWFQIRVARAGNRLEMDFEGRPVFRWQDPEPLPGGFAGLWSRDSGILIPRVTLYH